MAETEAADGHVWKRQPVALTFYLGDLPIARPRLSLLCRSASCDEAPLQPPHTPAPPAGAAAEFVVRSQPIAGAFPAISVSGGRLVYVPRQYRRFLIDLDGDFESYMNAFSGKTRSTLRRKLRKYKEASGGKIDWRSYTRREEMHDFFAAALEVSAASYQERLFGKGLPGSAAYIDEACSLAARDRIRAFVLRLNGAPISYLYCPVAGEVLKYAYLGYVPDYAALSPGTVLQMLALESLFAEKRFRSFDFTEGEGEHKALFSNRHVLCADIFVLRPTVRTVAIVTAQLGTDRLSRRTGALLEKLHVKSTLRQFLRRSWKRRGA